MLTKVRSVPAAAAARIRSWTIGAAALNAEAGYLRHATSQLAAAISDRMLFSLVPLFALLVSVVSLVAPDEQRNRIARWLADMIPGTELEESIRRAVADAGTPATAAGLVAPVTLLWPANARLCGGTILVSVIATGDRAYAWAMVALIVFGLVGLGAAIFLPSKLEREAA